MADAGPEPGPEADTSGSPDPLAPQPASPESLSPESLSPEPTPDEASALDLAGRQAAARRARFDTETAPGARVIAVYAIWALLWIGGWTIYSSARGFALVPGLVLTTAFVVVPFVLGGEGARALAAGRYWQGVVALTFSLGFLGFAGSGQITRAMLFPGDPAPIPAQLPAGVTRIDYQASDGQPLVGLLIRAQAPQAPTLVYFHGNAESAVRNLDLGLALRKRGCHVFLAEFRGFGGVGGEPTEAGLLLDGEAALASVERELGTSASQVVLCGRSLGSGVASGLAGRGRGRRVILLSPYTSITDVASRMAPRPLAWLAVRDPLDSRSALTQRSVPLLVFHGDRDGVVPYPLGKELAAAAGGELVTLPGVGHNDLLSPPHGSAILDRWVAFARLP